MNALRFSFLVVSFSVSAALAACGGDVSSSGDAGSSSTSGSSSSSSGSAPKGVEACYDFCHTLQTNNCPAQPPDCTTYCDPMFANAGAECSDELGALYACYQLHSASCPDEPPMQCQSLADAVQACVEQFGCVGGSCFGGGGVGGNGSVSQCGCDETCKMKKYETSCTSDGAQSTCDCLVDGISVGTCMDGADPICGVKDGCCNQFFKL